MDWLITAQTLPSGGKTRIDHNCGPGRTLVVNNDHKAYTCHCYRCDFNGYHSKGIQTLAQLAKINELNERAAETIHNVDLPSDFTYDIPLEGRLWLYKGGISTARARTHGIGYSPSYQRVVLPVFNSSKNIVWFQLRAVLRGQRPKYVQPSAERAGIYYTAGNGLYGKRAIIVEDILSAIRVGACETTYALLGTKITTAQTGHIGKHPRIVTWFDNDPAGIDGSFKVRQSLGLLTEASNLVTAKDPKCYSDRQIRRILSD